MMFWIEFDLLFAFFYMQLITIVFCIVLDIISTFFCMQHHHSVLDGVGLDIDLILRAGDIHAFLGGVDLIFTLSSLIIVRFWIDLIFAFFYTQVITDYHDVLD